MVETLNLEPSYQLAEDLTPPAGVRAGVVVFSILALAERELLGRVLLADSIPPGDPAHLKPVEGEERDRLVKMP